MALSDSLSEPKTDIIIIARHGRPALSRKVNLTGPEYRDWWKRYDESGLREGQSAPETFKTHAAGADIIISSPRPRAVETAIQGSGRDPDQIDWLFDEAALPSPGLGRLKLPPIVWGTLSRIVWLSGYSGGMESVRAARVRAVKAADLLQINASNGKIVFVTAHGWFNRMVGTQLRRRGWRVVEDQGDGYWDFRRYERVKKIK